MTAAPPPLHVDDDVGGPPEETSVLVASVKLRFPNLKPEGLVLRGAEKVELLADHIAATAVMRGELAQLRLEAHAELLTTDDEWDAVQASGNSMAARERAREQARPILARRRKHARFTIERCTEEMERMDADYNSASRCYTILSGS